LSSFTMVHLQNSVIWCHCEPRRQWGRGRSNLTQWCHPELVEGSIQSPPSGEHSSPKGRKGACLMTRRVTVLTVLLLALLGLTGCLVYGGGYYQPQYVCYDVFVGYNIFGQAVYQTVCEWQSIAPEDVGDQEISGIYVSEGNVLTRTIGADLAVGQLIELQPAEGSSSFISVDGVSKPEVRKAKE